MASVVVYFWRIEDFLEAQERGVTWSSYEVIGRSASAFFSWTNVDIDTDRWTTGEDVFAGEPLGPESEAPRGSIVADKGSRIAPDNGSDASAEDNGSMTPGATEMITGELLGLWPAPGAERGPRLLEDEANEEELVDTTNGLSTKGWSPTTSVNWLVSSRSFSKLRGFVTLWWWGESKSQVVWIRTLQL